jgi:hypothetical protein
MIIVRNDKLIKRNGRIGQWTSLAALGVLGIGMYLNFTKPTLWFYSIGALVLGFIMTQIGLSFSNRWGRSPRPDEQLDSALKGLPADSAIYHYTTAVPHLLAGPMGLWVLLPYSQGGKLAFKNNRWRLSGGGFVQWYLGIFGQGGIGRPDLEAAYQVEAMKRHLAKNMGEGSVPQVHAALVFSNDRIEIDGNEAPVPALQIRKLKDFMRQRIREGAAPSALVRQIKEHLPQP